VPSSVACPQAADDVLELGSGSHDSGQPGLTRAASGWTAVVGAIVVGAGLIFAVILSDLVLGDSLRGVVLSGANLATAAVMEAFLVVGVLLGAFLARK
jgi:hypothetical protein